MSLLDSKLGGIEIGNYKGVMLCNRPFGGVSAAHAKSDSSGPKSFGCGVVPSEIGYHVGSSNKEKHKVKRPSKESALARHKKWLSELQATKDRLELAYVDEINRKTDAKENFRKQEKKMRNLSKTLLHEVDSKFSSTEEPKEEPESKDSESEAKLPSKKDKKNKNKPAWAKTEVADEDITLADETERELLELVGGAKDEETDELLDFAKSLDYDKYMNDMEIKTMMKQVRKRIAELEHSVSQDEKRFTEEEMKLYKKELQSLKDLSQGPRYEVDSDSEGEVDEHLEAAKEVLKLDNDMKAVHSTKSVAALVKSSKEKDDSGAARVVNEPVIIVHDANEGNRLNAQAKNAISNLPYMHRNPAI